MSGSFGIFGSDPTLLASSVGAYKLRLLRAGKPAVEVSQSRVRRLIVKTKKIELNSNPSMQSKKVVIGVLRHAESKSALGFRLALLLHWVLLTLV